MRALLAAVAAILLTMCSYCARTGRWVYDYVAKPACIGTAQAGLGLLSTAAQIPGAIARSLVGAAPATPMPPGGVDHPGVGEVTDALEAVEQRRGARAALRAMQRAAPVSLEAAFVHRWATASREGRLEMDLEELPPHLQEWLLELTTRQLAHLAQSPAVCQLAVSGQRTGLVGMPIPAERPFVDVARASSTNAGIVGEVLRSPEALAGRVRSAKGRPRPRVH